MAGAAGWLFADRLTAQHYSLPAAQYWNTLVRAGFFLIVASILTVLKRVVEHEREVARTDWLTGLPNNRSFLESALREVERSRRTQEPLTMAYIDVDGFKAVNDNFGHAAGDNLLRQIADTLRSGLRAVDLVARLGGDEFAVLLPGADRQQARIALGRLHGELLAAANAGGWPFSVSIGAVVFDEPPSVEDMLRQADIAMYGAKRAGGGGTRFEEPGGAEA
jgi:diguanylate cyclase (GGDEF)-like protein